MSIRFQWLPDAHGVKLVMYEKGLLGRKQTVPFSDWNGKHPKANSVVRHMKLLIEYDDAHIDGDGNLYIRNSAIQKIPAALAKITDMPALSGLILRITFRGRVESPDSVIETLWADSSCSTVFPEVTGMFERNGGGEYRQLSPRIYELYRAILSYNNTRDSEAEKRIEQWLNVQNALQKVTQREVQADSYAEGLTIYQAGAFSLDVQYKNGGPDFEPVLMARSKCLNLEDEAAAPEISEEGELQDSSENELRDEQGDALLPHVMQQKFIRESFSRSNQTHDAYVLAKNTFVVIEPELKSALDTVKQAKHWDREQKEEFIKNPCTFLRGNADGHQDDAGLVFVETRQYSERIAGLGIWDKPQISFLSKQKNQWLPEKFPVKVGDKELEMSREELSELQKDIETARQNGDETVTCKGEETPIVDAEAAVQSCLREAPDFSDVPAPDDQDGTANVSSFSEQEQAPLHNDQQVLIAKDNIEALEHKADIRKRRNQADISMLFSSMKNSPKSHQVEGLNWLIEAWRSGWPGVLLADDMGLGKTFQTLAFMAWLKLNKRANVSGPILVVAPTALLKNWLEEADIHLDKYCLGDCVEAYGPGLRRIIRQADNPEEKLDHHILSGAGWILTTYETLSRYHRAFARIHYSMAIFDEMQKIKSPTSINTNAAKTINANFVLGLTGTPIENRLEDLWCIMDRIAPGHLGSLKAFSSTYKEDAVEELQNLKVKLDQPQNSRPAIMLRRMKEDISDDLPEKTISTCPCEMAPEQAQAYETIVNEASNSEQSPGRMLDLIHKLRGISLHPCTFDEAEDPYSPTWRQAWVQKSARLKKTMEILTVIQRRNEKALVFLEDRKMQESFSIVAAEHFQLDEEPKIINGSLAGEKRKAVVDHFQKKVKGFDLLVLSPKAAGVGLTITAANHVIHLSRWWNPAIEDQCNDRAYRIGQKKNVTVHIPQAIHPVYGDASFDIKLHELLERKRKLSRDMLMPPVCEGDYMELFSSLNTSDTCFQKTG